MSASTAASNNRLKIVVVGTSLGGLEALGTLLAGLPREFPLPVAVVQHRAADGKDAIGPLLQARSALPVREVEDKERILPGCIYLAPRDYHLLVDDDSFALSTDAPVNAARPSIDVLFESAAETYGPGAIGVILTGASEDGARGAARIKQHYGLVVAQDPATAEAPTAPRAAIDASTVDTVLPLEEIAPFLVDTCGVVE
jgi:two-component system, chemotaxis family, protein-glutamate methylesterase/glutaminase